MKEIKNLIDQSIDEWYRQELERREKRCAGKTPEEIRLLELKERIDGLNASPGKLTGYDCPKCLNRGYRYAMPTDPAADAVTVYCDCDEIRRTQRIIAASGLDKAVREKTFEAFSTAKQWQKDMKSLAVKYAEADTNAWFMLSGQSGSGKTHLCTAIIASVFAHGKPAIYLPYRDEIPRLKRYSLDDRYYSQKMDAWQTVPVLYIDDLFKKGTTADIGIMFELLDYRARNDLRTIISTELSFAELLAIDEAVAGRIIEKCGDWLIQIEKDNNKNQRTISVLEKE